MCLSLCQHYSVLIILFVLSFEMKNMRPETLFFFFNVLAILGLMYFHVNFELVNFRKKKSQLEF